MSEVLWNMLLDLAFNMESMVIRTIAIFLIFGAWFFLTICILLFMEGLSAFLHALRLHWVEFVSLRNIYIYIFHFNNNVFYIDYKVY